MKEVNERLKLIKKDEMDLPQLDTAQSTKNAKVFSTVWLNEHRKMADSQWSIDHVLSSIPQIIAVHVIRYSAFKYANLCKQKGGHFEIWNLKYRWQDSCHFGAHASPAWMKELPCSSVFQNCMCQFSCSSTATYCISYSVPESVHWELAQSISRLAWGILLYVRKVWSLSKSAPGAELPAFSKSA